MVSPRKKETRPIPIQIFILTHYQKQKNKKQNKTKQKKKNLHLQFDLFINTIFKVTSSNSTCTSRSTCTSPMVGQRSTQGQGTRGLEWSTMPCWMRTRWLWCTSLKISRSFSDHASIVNEVLEFILKCLRNKSPIVKQNV